MATRSAQKHFAAADRVGVVRSLVDLKVSCRDALGLSNPISQRIEFALFLTQTLHDVADSLELPAARDGFLVAFESLTHAREGTDSSWLSVCVETGTAQEPSRLTAQSLALDGYSKQGLHARDGAAVNATSTEYLSPAFSEAQASTTSKSDTAIFTPTASRSLSISDPSKGDPSNGLADAHSTTITESDTLTLPSRHHFSRNAASPEGPLKAAVPSGSPKSLKRTRALQENRQTIPSKKKAKGGCRQEYRSTDKDCEAVTKKTRQALQIHKPSDAGNGGVQICRHAIESLLIGRKVMPDSPWTVDKLVYDLQEFADSLRNDGDNANYQRSNLPEFIDGMGKTFATFASYFEELIEGMELVRLTRTSERLPPEGDHAQQCLYHHRAFHSKSAQCNVLTLGRFHDLYQLRVAHCALVEELSMVGKPIHHWARMNSVPSLQKAAICSRYLAHLAASECPGTFESTLLSIQHDLTLSSKLYDIVQEVGPGFLILLAKHLTPSQVSKIPAKSLISFLKHFRAIFPNIRVFSKRLWRTIVSRPASRMFQDMMSAHSESSLFELLILVDQTESKVLTMARRWKPQRPSDKTPVDSKKVGEHTSQHSYNKSIQAIFDHHVEEPPGLPHMAKRFFLDEFRAIPGFGTLYGLEHWAPQTATIEPALSLSHLTQMLSKEFSLIIVFDQSGIGSARNYDQVEEMARLLSEYKIEAVHSSRPVGRHSTKQISRTNFKRIFVDAKKSIKPEEEGYSINCLGIPSAVVFPTDEFLLEFDLVELIARNMGSTGVVLHDALEMQELYNDVRRGWWLYTTPGAFSTFHKDKAGLCTILVVEQGQKDWFVAEDNDPRAGKEGLWPERISGISILQGTLAIQGPGVLHSVFTPVLSKVFGRFFWHKLLLHKTIDSIATQILNATKENEVILASDYRLLTLIFRNIRFAKLESSVVEKINKSVRHLLRALNAPIDGEFDGRNVLELEKFADKYMQPNVEFLEICPRWARVLIEKDGVGKAWGRYRHCSEYTYMIWFVDEITKFATSACQIYGSYRGDRSLEPLTRRCSNRWNTSVVKAQASRKSVRRPGNVNHARSSAGLTSQVPTPNDSEESQDDKPVGEIFAAAYGRCTR